MIQHMDTDKATHALHALEEALAAVCSVALKELERDGLDAWSWKVQDDDPNTDRATVYTAKKVRQLDTAVRILAAVADGDTDLDVAAAVYLDPVNLIKLQREDWFDQDVLFFTDCEVCAGQLVSVGGGDSAPSSCAACADPDFRDTDPNERRQEAYGTIARTLLYVARTPRD